MILNGQANFHFAAWHGAVISKSILANRRLSEALNQLIDQKLIMNNMLNDLLNLYPQYPTSETVIHSFSAQYFIQCLAETEAWCSIELMDEQNLSSLKTVVSLPNETLHPLTSDEELSAIVDQVITMRRTLLAGKNLKIMPSETVNLAGGRLLIFARESAFANDGVLELSSGGFFNYYGYPRWDTWVQYYIEEVEQKNEKEPGYNLFHIICWVPPQLIEAVDHAIPSNADNSVYWLQIP